MKNGSRTLSRKQAKVRKERIKRRLITAKERTATRLLVAKIKQENENEAES